MTDLRKAAELALEALEFAASEIYNEHNDDVIADAIEALRTALAQPEQEPVAVWELTEDGWETIADAEWMETLPFGTKLYTAPPSKQEPVAWISDSPTKGNGKQLYWTMEQAWKLSSNITPLYTAPPSKQDVNQELVDALTSIAEYWNQDTNHEAMVDACHYMTDTARAALAKLKEKNNG